MNGNYLLDKQNGKLMGVCSGFARWTGLDPLLVRLGTAAVALFLAPILILFYLAVGWLAPAR